MEQPKQGLKRVKICGIAIANGQLHALGKFFSMEFEKIQNLQLSGKVCVTGFLDEKNNRLIVETAAQKPGLDLKLFAQAHEIRMKTMQQTKANSPQNPAQEPI